MVADTHSYPLCHDHHQKDERIEAHIYLTILAYQLVNTHYIYVEAIKYPVQLAQHSAGVGNRSRP